MILTDRAVLASLVVGVAVLAVHLLLPGRFRRSETIAVLGIAAGFRVAGRDLDRYQELPPRLPGWMVPLLVLAVIAAAAAVAWTASRRRPEPTLSVAVALATAGVFLCVPETGVVRLVVGPALLAGLAVGVGVARPLAAASALAAIAGLAWLALIDGHTRGSAIVGAAACIGVIALVPLIERASPTIDRVPAPDRHPFGGFGDPSVVVGQAILAVAVLACSRWAGIQRSTTVAVFQVAVVLAATAGALLWLRTARVREPQSPTPPI